MLTDCEACGTRFAPGLAVCPHCQTTNKDLEMAKAHRHREPSDLNTGSNILDQAADEESERNDDASIDGDGSGDDGGGDGSGDQDPTVPGSDAKKADWVAYAVAVGLDEAAMEALTIAGIKTAVEVRLGE